MPRARQDQLNIRSAYARARAHDLARLTGMTATQVVEDALRGFVPERNDDAKPGLVRRASILVKPAGAARISHEQADLALDEVREGGGTG